MSDDNAPMAVGYSGRWNWLKAMLAQPKGVLSDATKLVLVAIWEAMDSTTGVTARTHGTLADALGMKESGVRACATKAVKAGWLLSEGKGGIRYDERGNPHGIANRFKLAQPAMAVARISAITCDETDSKVLWNREQGAMESAPTRYGHSDNPLSFPSSSPIDSPEGADESLPDGIAEAPIVSMEGKGSETQEIEPQPPLPVADHKERSDWLVWPDAEPIETMMGWGEEWRWHRIADTALELLGWHPKADKAAFGAISKALQDPYFEWKGALMERYEAGTLTKSDLANVLAVAGINPPAAQKEEVANG
jgi:hypothetical protein